MSQRPIQSRRVRSGGLEMAYDEIAGDGRPFVLVHGFTGARIDFDEVLADVAPGGRVLAPDQRGHGETGRPSDGRPYSLETLVADLAGFLDATDASPCDLLGHSMGGMVALRFALAHPERVSSLILMDTSASMAASTMREQFQIGAKIIREQGGKGLLAAMRAVENPAATPPSVLRVRERQGEAYYERVERKLTWMDPDAFAELGRLLYEQEPVTARLGEIACPTTVIVGVEDAPFRAPSEELASAIPGAKLVVIPDAAHSPQVENRAAWLDAVRVHLRGART